MKAIKWIISALVAVVIIAAAVGGGVYFTRLKSIHSIRKLTDYENYNLYRMDIDYAYDLDRLIDRGITDNQSMINAILAEALPYLPIHMKAPNFGCSAFCTQGTDGHTLMGRNYDFRNDTSAMLVYCTPKDGYASVAFAALDNINANTPDASMAKKLATLTAPFICLDGMNEKGVSIAVLTLDSDPTYQQTGKPMIATTLAIRLVLDRAATTAEAVELLSKYDMFASSGRDYHFYITDASGDVEVVISPLRIFKVFSISLPSAQMTHMPSSSAIPDATGSNGAFKPGFHSYPTIFLKSLQLMESRGFASGFFLGSSV